MVFLVPLGTPLTPILLVPESRWIEVGPARRALETQRALGKWFLFSGSECTSEDEEWCDMYRKDLTPTDLLHQHLQAKCSQRLGYRRQIRAGVARSAQHRLWMGEAWWSYVKGKLTTESETVTWELKFECWKNPLKGSITETSCIWVNGHITMPGTCLNGTLLVWVCIQPTGGLSLYKDTCC